MTSTTTWKLFSDGGSRGNPGPSACSYALFDPAGNLRDKCGNYLGEATNNHAEYCGLLAGVEAAVKAGTTELDCYLDSELVVKQMKGEYRIKDANLKSIADKIKELQINFIKLSFNHVPREKNQIADRLVNETLDAVKLL
ncbi:MAG: ribonuclease HI family protein [candidate division WWE3 bacterium]|nr:ribonuclease HI family protein [candidate division WWE3 bacterium]